LVKELGYAPYDEVSPDISDFCSQTFEIRRLDQRTQDFDRVKTWRFARQLLAHILLTSRACAEASPVFLGATRQAFSDGDCVYQQAKTAFILEDCKAGCAVSATPGAAAKAALTSGFEALSCTDFDGAI